MPSIIGLKITPKIYPSWSHILFRVMNAFGAVKAMIRKPAEKVIKKKPLEKEPYDKKYVPNNKKTNAKNKPNFLLDGNFMLEDFTFNLSL